jgi:hypothetical protein
MTPEAPEFRTKTLSPVSPLPLHPPEPSNIPVLRNQIDPIFNMTTTHLEKTPAAVTAPQPIQASEPSQDDSKSPSADSSFSDAYKEQTVGTVEQQADNADQATDISDDYAMAVDSDGEEQADSQDISQAKIESDAKSLPVAVQDHPLASSILSYDPPTTDLAQPGQNIQPTPTNPNTAPPTVDATANNDYYDTVAAQNSIEATKPGTQTYDDIASGGIDIQQLLDNITANAEKNDSNSTVTTTLLLNPPRFPPLSKATLAFLLMPAFHHARTSPKCVLILMTFRSTTQEPQVSPTLCIL